MHDRTRVRIVGTISCVLSLLSVCGAVWCVIFPYRLSPEELVRMRAIVGATPLFAVGGLVLGLFVTRAVMKARTQAFGHSTVSAKLDFLMGTVGCILGIFAFVLWLVHSNIHATAPV